MDVVEFVRVLFRAAFLRFFGDTAIVNRSSGKSHGLASSQQRPDCQAKPKRRFLLARSLRITHEFNDIEQAQLKYRQVTFVSACMHLRNLRLDCHMLVVDFINA